MSKKLKDRLRIIEWFSTFAAIIIVTASLIMPGAVSTAAGEGEEGGETSSYNEWSWIAGSSADGSSLGNLSSQFGSAGNTGDDENAPANRAVDEKPNTLIKMLSSAIAWIGTAISATLNAIPSVPMTLTAIVMGNVATGKSYFVFSLQDGNLYGTVGAFLYAALQTICLSFIFIASIYSIIKNMWKGESKAGQFLKDNILAFATALLLLFLMPQIVDTVCIWRDKLSIYMYKAVSAASPGTDAGYINHIENAYYETYTNCQNLVNAGMYTLVCVLPIVYVVAYVKVAIMQLILFGLFPMFVALGFMDDKKALGQWAVTFMSNCFVPVIDMTLLLLPSVLLKVLDYESGGTLSGTFVEGLIVVTMFSAVVPTRNQILSFVGNNWGVSNGKGLIGLAAGVVGATKTIVGGAAAVAGGIKSGVDTWKQHRAENANAKDSAVERSDIQKELSSKATSDIPPASQSGKEGSSIGSGGGMAPGGLKDVPSQNGGGGESQKQGQGQAGAGGGGSAKAQKPPEMQSAPESNSQTKTSPSDDPRVTHKGEYSDRYKEDDSKTFKKSDDRPIQKQPEMIEMKSQGSGDSQQTGDANKSGGSSQTSGADNTTKGVQGSDSINQQTGQPDGGGQSGTEGNAADNTMQPQQTTAEQTMQAKSDDRSGAAEAMGVTKGTASESADAAQGASESQESIYTPEFQQMASDVKANSDVDDGAYNVDRLTNLAAMDNYNSQVADIDKENASLSVDNAADKAELHANEKEIKSLESNQGKGDGFAMMDAETSTKLADLRTRNDALRNNIEERSDKMAMNSAQKSVLNNKISERKNIEAEYAKADAMIGKSGKTFNSAQDFANQVKTDAKARKVINYKNYADKKFNGMLTDKQRLEYEHKAERKQMAAKVMTGVQKTAIYGTAAVEALAAVGGGDTQSYFNGSSPMSGQILKQGAQKASNVSVEDKVEFLDNAENAVTGAVNAGSAIVGKATGQKMQENYMMNRYKAGIPTRKKDT